ncbi:hypothetical protein [Bartonella phoceensis]|nr:hypothetical protein [Bartonella phoceensis]
MPRVFVCSYNICFFLSSHAAAHAQGEDLDSSSLVGSYPCSVIEKF